LIQTAVGRVSGRGGPTGSTVIVRGVTPIKGGTDYSLYRLTMAGYLLGVGLPGLALDAPDVLLSLTIWTAMRWTICAINAIGQYLWLTYAARYYRPTICH
jgi:hypothetical protein